MVVLKQVIIVRQDLKLGKGKLCGQVAHASISAYENSKFKKEWIEQGQKKVVVKCKNLEELLEIYEKAKINKLPVALIQDAGLTQISEGTITCVGIGPDDEKKIDNITGNLKLL